MTPDLPAAEGGTPVRSEFLPFARPAIGQHEIDEVVETLMSGWLTVGPKTRRFEELVARYVGVESAAAVNSCTAGLHLAMVVFGVAPGDEVVLPALNFAAAPNTVIHMGARPVLVDVDPKTLNITAGTVEAAMTDRTRLVVPVHFAGRPCPIEEILEVARRRGAKVLGDGAHAIGANARGKKVGAVADATSFSFYVTKGVTTGEGGMVTSPHPEIVRAVSALSLHGMSSDAWKRYGERGPWYYEILAAGYKYNMNDIQAALGLCQMDRVDEFRERRADIAAVYHREFSREEGLSIPADFDEGHHAWHLYPVRLRTESLRISRDEFILALTDEGIGVSVHFIPLHYHPFYRKHLEYRRGDFPATEDYFDRAISLPVYPTMSEEDALDVTRAVRKLLRYYER